MAEQKQRSVFWVVSTHLLTTGFVMPLLARIFASIAISTMSLQFPVSGLILLASLVLGYIGGAFYSLSYIRKVAIIENPTACIMPSIIGFTVLAILGLAANLAAQLIVMGGNTNGTITVVAMVGFYVVICVAFAMITRRGFAPRTEESSGES